MESNIDILLVGKTGNGKSATANSIVGNDAFKSEASFDSVTKQAQFEYSEVDGRILKVVDGPGVGDTSLDTKEAVQLVVDAMTFAVAANPAGFHAILLVVRSDVRFTKEEIDTIQLLKDIFGKDFIRGHAILLMTHGDSLKVKDTSSFEDWIRSQRGYVKELTDECGGRVILFDNVTNDKQKKEEQNRKLLNMIDHLAGSGTRYTSDIFNMAKQTRDRLVMESKKPHLSEKVIMVCGIINQQLSRMNFENLEAALDLLDSLKKRAEDLENDIKMQDQGTSSLRVAINLAQQMKDSICERMKRVREVLLIRQQEEQLTAEGDVSDTEEKSKTMEDQLRLKEKMKMRKAHQVELQEEQRKLHEMLAKQKERETEFFRENYETVKKEHSWTWYSVAAALKGYVERQLIGWFLRKDT